MHHFLVKSGPHNSRNNDVTFLVYLNGRLVPKDEYSLEADSFFKAALTLQGTIVFVGSCGDKWCCNLGMNTQVTVDNWIWDDYVISWPDACQGARHILREIESGRYLCSDEELVLYKSSLKQIEKYVI